MGICEVETTRRRMPSRSALVSVGLVGAVVVFAGVRCLKGSGSLRTFISPALDKTGTRLQLMYPSGWQPRPMKPHANSQGVEVTIVPEDSLRWLPFWLRQRFGAVERDAFLVVNVY